MNEAICNLCGGREVRLVFPGRSQATFSGPYQPSHHTSQEHFPLVRCQNCGLIYAWPRPRNEQLNHYYEAYDDTTYEAEAESRQEIAQWQLQWLEKFGPTSASIPSGIPRPKRLLEIGAATGIFLAQARAVGYEVTGIEPSRWAREIALKKHGLVLREGDLASQNLPDDHFDVVCLFDVIEHLDNPRATLAEVGRILAPNGLAVLLTPDIGHWRARLLGGRWWGIQQSHVFYFSRETMTKLLATVGLGVVTIGAGMRIFPLRYWAQQLSGYSRPLAAMARVICRGAIGRWKVGMRFPDHMMVLAKKVAVPK